MLRPLDIQSDEPPTCKHKPSHTSLFAAALLGDRKEKYLSVDVEQPNYVSAIDFSS